MYHVAIPTGDVTGHLCAKVHMHAHGRGNLYVYLMWACVFRHCDTFCRCSVSMQCTDCVTEVTLHPSLPVHELYQRLHQHLPSSPYTQGAIYLPVRDGPESPNQQESRVVLITKAAVPPPPPAPILLLRGDFKWRFGGKLEQSTSPPWSWMSEELCGKPYPYIARDFNGLHPRVGSTPTPRCPLHQSLKATSMLVNRRYFLADPSQSLCRILFGSIWAVPMHSITSKRHNCVHLAAGCQKNHTAAPFHGSQIS